jgi:tRNA threonylcarbamoyladenosine biosynthesis protein TsaB
MKLTLAIDTATARVGLALGGPDGVVAELGLQQGRRHAEVLAPAIESVMRLAGVGLDQIQQVAVDVGPGLFTGLRVGVATAKALASALNLPVVACTSLDVLAHPHRGLDGPVASVVDARRGQVFWAMYQPTVDGEALVQTIDATVCDPAVLTATLERIFAESGDRIAVAGDGARRYADQLEAVQGVGILGREHDHPSASALIAVAASRPALAADKVTAYYLRDPDVRIGWTRRDG